MLQPVSGLRSERWFGGRDISGFIHRASVHAEGISRNALAGRPVVGICNSWSELVHCNLHFRGLAEAVKRGVLLAGGLPLEFPTISLGENLMKPTAMLFRNLMAMDVEECIRANPLDSVVLLGGCDKTIPAQLMGAASADLPAIMLTGGPSQPGWFRGRQLADGTDLWHYADELRAGRMSEAEFDEFEAAATPGFGHCNEMGTASTMASLVEALGMSLPGTASIPAVDAARVRAAEATGARAVELARGGPRPVADPHRRGVRQRDLVADGDRRWHERRHSSPGARGPRRRAVDARSLPRALPSARRCWRTFARRVSISSRSFTARAASAPFCMSSPRCSTATRSPSPARASPTGSPARRCSTAA